MRNRAAVILRKGNQIALIERHRAGLHYFVFPGGGIEPGETPEKAAMREAHEELGLSVRVGALRVVVHLGEDTQYYYEVESSGGEFGSGQGEEMTHPRPERGSFQPTWVEIESLAQIPLKPEFMAEVLQKSEREGWAEHPVEVQV